MPVGGELYEASQLTANIECIPDAVLAQCLELVPQSERLQSVSLVCKRFYDVCFTPALLRGIDVTIGGERALPRARALLRWLVGRARHVRTVRIEVEPVSSDSEAEDEELSATVCSILAALSHAGQVEVLEAGPLPALPTLAWLPALRRLKTLSLDRECTTAQRLVIPPMQEMTALQRLELGGQQLLFDSATQLPPSLTHLLLCDTDSASMPYQVAQLPNLRSLELTRASYSGTSMDSLTQLHSLTRLVLWSIQLPDCLPQLNRLRHLEVWDVKGSSVELLDDALWGMHQLTCLLLSSQNSFVAEFPPGLASLPNLQRCMLWVPLPEEEENEEVEDEEGGGMLEQRRLPSGPWLHNLRYLCTHWGILANSAAELASAKKLEYVCLADMPDLYGGIVGEKARWEAFWEWAAVHPPMRRLSFSIHDETPFPRCLVHMMLRLQQRRPALSVYINGTDGHPTFCEEANAA